ncbi:MAG TPA: Zn-ribbon domain-containing OB-fold protein [Patescibacteria group bacterium]
MSLEINRSKEVNFSGRGTIYSFAIMRDAPSGFEKYLPYAVALIRLEEGNMITAQLTDVDLDQIYIGMPVEMVTRRLSEDGDNGIIVYGYKFRPPLMPQ